ncbi:MAG: PIG-L family deacetylase [Anaerolineae bacterium]|nr:PIG-L family deacetylase [Anaerolineae bacterium]
MSGSLSLMAVFAHPDDEGSVSGALARYVTEGVRVTLTCATRGEAATIYCDDCATSETLAQVRTREMEAACRHLGVQDLRWLDWPDGGVSLVERGEAVARIGALMREVRPQVVITHPPHGGYAHPDHLALWEIVGEAWQRAGNSSWSPDKLYYRAIPESSFNLVPRLRDYRIHLKGVQLPFTPTPDDEITTILNVSRWLPQKEAAWSAHSSQLNPNGFFSTMPEEMRREWRRWEHLVLAKSRLVAGSAVAPAQPDGKESDLFLGLR